MCKMQNYKEREKLDNWRNFHLFAFEIQGDISFQKQRNFWVAKALMSSYILCKILSFQTQITEIFRFLFLALSKA